MKFVSNATVTDYANQLDAVQARLARLQEQVKAAKAEEEALITFLAKKVKREPFSFTPVRGRYLKVVEFCPRTRKILDQARARKRLLEAGLKVPVRVCNWLEANVRLATDDDAE